MRLFIFLIGALFVSFYSLAQISDDDSLFMVMKVQDSLLFELGFNQCDMLYLENHIADDLKFYHDQSGVQDRETFLENVVENLCPQNGKKPIRKLEEGSLEVFPLYKDGALYGVIQTGKHNFYLREDGMADEWTSTAFFTHVWILDEDTWKLSTVLSYDHQNGH